MTKNRIALIVALTGLMTQAAVEIDTSPDRVDVPLEVNLKRIGTLRPRSTTEIRSSNLMLGCECSDRDLVDFEGYKRFLPPLGVKTIRLQGGWAKCEKEKGRYDFSWLDKQVDFAIANGINVYLDTEYGNHIYPGCNGVDLGGKFPTGEVAVAAWDRWVDAISKHFKGRVRDWSMWNEPWCSAEEIAAQNIRTAKVIKRNIPDARIGAFSLGDCRAERLEKCVKALGDDKGLFTWVVYHGYKYAPEQNFEEIDKIRAMLDREFPSAILRQGENGCPSEYLPHGWVLNGVPWSEYSQAKWILRRMLGDLGHDVMTDVFQIVDFYNPKRKIVDGVFNTKGLLRTGLDQKVVDIKLAYYAVQNLASVFDDRWARVKDSALYTTDPGIAHYEFVKETGERMYLFWRFTSTVPTPLLIGDTVRDEEALKPVPVRPGDSFATAPQVFLVKGTAAPLRDPVWVDVFTGRVYELPKRKVAVSSDAVRYMSVPVYDSPCFLTERSALDLQ